MENEANNEKVTSGKHLSFWLSDQEEQLKFSPLKENIITDVVIVGAGIAGLSVAYGLIKTGHKVVVIEDGYIGSGETGHTTAHLCNALDDRYYHLQNLFGEENSRLIAQSHTHAIDFIERTLKEEHIDCDFERLNGYLFLHASDKKESLEKELEAATKAGLDVKLLPNIPGLDRVPGQSIAFSKQAQFHPIKYLNGLAKAIFIRGGAIYTGTHAAEINAEGIRTSSGFSVQAKHIVVATNSPVNDKYVMHMKQFPYRTYVIGAKIPKGRLKKALWWDTGNHDINSTVPPYHYVRLQELDEQHDLLICGGEDHATGLADADKIPEEDRYDLLETWTRNRFDIHEVVYRWSGQVMEPMDAIGFIGRNPMDKDNVYIVTGDSGNGITHGAIAGILIPDLINGKENSWEKIYDPSRVKWLSAGGTFFKEFVGGFISYLKHKPKTDPDQLLTLEENEGKVLEWDGKKCGIYRDDHNVIHVVDASCTHLKCTVKWNNDEKSWDCPCHGSRFTYQGAVMNGPANKNLEYHAEKWEKAVLKI